MRDAAWRHVECAATRGGENPGLRAAGSPWSSWARRLKTRTRPWILGSIR